jgi:hypothetical protein
MRFVLNVDQALAVAGLGFCLAVGWEAGRWLAAKLLAFIRM